MNRKMAIAGIAAILLIGGVLFFALGGLRLFGRMPGGPWHEFGEFRDNNQFSPRPGFGEFGDDEYFARIGDSLGLPEGSTKEQVLEALGLPEDASQEQIRDALQQKGIMPTRRN